MAEVLNVHRDKFSKLHPRISGASEKLIFSYPYYSDIILSCNFVETKDIPTAGVNVSTKGFNFYYNPAFIDSLASEACVMFLIIHEIFHLLFSHPSRTVAGKYNHHLANVAQDMIINSIIVKDICEKEGYDFCDIIHEIDDKGERRNNALFIPKEYTEEWIFEKLYAWLKEKADEKKEQDKEKGDSQDGEGSGEPQEGQGEGSDEPQDGEGQGSGSGSGKGSGKKSKEKGEGSGDDEKSESDDSGKYGKNGAQEEECYDLDTVLDNVNNHDNPEAIEKAIKTTIDEHIGDDVPKELRDQMVKDMIAKIKSRGHDAGNFEDILKKLRKSKKNYTREIKRAISDVKGSHKIGTWKRLNRREKPTKGFKRNSNVVNLILDTSGSMNGYFEKVLGYVFHDDIQINAIQIDTRVYDLGMIKRKSELQKMKIVGGGGTTMQPAIDVIRNKYNKFSTIMLTDGYTDSLDLTGIKGKFLILTVDNDCPIGKSNGKLKQICIKDQ